MNKLNLTLTLFASASFLLSGCSSSSSSNSTPFVENSAPSAQDLEAVSSSVDSALPSYSSAPVVTQSLRFMRKGVQDFVFPAKAYAVASPVLSGTDVASVWASTTASELIQPPGGVAQQGETYPDVDGLDFDKAGEAVENVNLQDFVGYHLESAYARDSGDGGIFKPTLFGQLDSMFNVLGVLSGGIPGEMVAGTYDFCVTEDDAMNLENAACPDPIDDTVLSVSVEVVDVSTEQSLFDRAVQVSAGGEPFVWYWIRNSAEELNILQLEPANQEKSSVGINTLLQNKETGGLIFESLDSGDDSDADAQSKVMRLVIEGGEDAKVYFSAFEGNSGGSGTYHNAFLVETESAVLDDAGGFARIQMNIEDQRDSTSASISGSVCIDLNDDGAIATSSSCTTQAPDLADSGTGDFIEYIQAAIDVTSLDTVTTAYNVSAWTDSANVLAGPASLGFSGTSNFEVSLLNP